MHSLCAGFLSLTGVGHHNSLDEVTKGSRAEKLELVRGLYPAVRQYVTPTSSLTRERPVQLIKPFAKQVSRNDRLRSVIRYDLPSSLVVFLVALPLSLGIAIASGAPVLAGLIAAIVGGIIVGAVGGSPLQVSGPAAGLTVVVADLISDFGWGVTCLITTAAGVLQVLLGPQSALREPHWRYHPSSYTPCWPASESRSHFNKPMYCWAASPKALPGITLLSCPDK